VHAALDVQPGGARTSSGQTEEPGAHNDDFMAGGVLEAAILGRASFDVMDVDVSTVRLAGAKPVMKAEYRDVGSEPRARESASVPARSLTATWTSSQIQREGCCRTLMPATDGEEKIATITGKTNDGRDFSASTAW